MIYNYLKVAIRNLLRNRTFSLINIFGLTLGTTSFLFIFSYVQHHRSYDQHHEDSDRIYRIVSDIKLASDNDVNYMATCSPPIPFTMKEDLPEVEEATRVSGHPGLDQVIIRAGKIAMNEKDVLYVDSTYLSMFDHNFISGDPIHALDEPYSVVITKQLSQKLFNNHSSVGETIQIGAGFAEQPFQVTGIFDHSLGNSHLMPEMLISMNSGGIGEFICNNTAWSGNNFIYGYVTLKPGTNLIQLASKLPDFLALHGSDQLADMSMEKSLHLQPLQEIHTNGDRAADRASNISASLLNILLIIAAFIQLLACINFMNLTTAGSTKRAKEVGIRKTVGAPRGAIAGQFLAESLLIALITTGLALPIVRILAPYLNHWLTLDFVDISFANTTTFVTVVGIGLLTGLIAGGYPALYLSAFKPLGAIKSKLKMSRESGSFIFRQGMVITQFTIAIVLIIGALIVRSQLQYMVNKDLGFDKNQKIVFSFESENSQRYIDLFRNEILSTPEVKTASAMNRYPGQRPVQDFSLYKEGENMSSSVSTVASYVDQHFFSTLDIDIIAGRALHLSDTSTADYEISVVANKTLVDRMGFSPEEILGQTLSSDFREIHLRATVVGVMEDFVYGSLLSEIEPFVVIAEAPQHLSYLVADVHSQDYSDFLNLAKNKWNAMIPDAPFEYSFLDANIEQLYQSEKTLSRMVGLFTLIAISISCLGLFGLSVFAAERRIKEIGVRKVLGATNFSIVKLLSSNFIKLVLVAILVASPIAYYLSQQWLSEYAHRISIGISLFVASGLGAMVLALLTVSVQGLRAATSNPIESLRDD